MGLDVYVGTFTRYFTGDWETIAQRLGREQGIPVEIIQPSAPPDAITDPDDIRNWILNWKRDFVASVREQADVEVDWSESPGEPYFTDKPGFDGLAALHMLAAYSLYPTERTPATIPDSWADDRVVRAYNDDEPRTLGTLFKARVGPPKEGRRFSHLTDLDTWIPGSFTGWMRVDGLAQSPMHVGSSSELLRQLQELNARTYRADRETMAGWLQVESDNSFDHEARRGLAIFTDLATKAVEHRLPMKLDY